MGFFERLLKGGMGGHGGGHHGGSRSHGGGHGGHGSGYYPPAPAAPSQGGAPAGVGGLVCAKCGTQGLPGARFCSGCGGQLMATSCQSCETALTPGARFCNQCGKPAP